MADKPGILRRVGAALRAYHGSPYDFDRFDATKIGTGEGAQAYGHGHYFAENEGVARGYRDKLAGPGRSPITQAEKVAHEAYALQLRDALNERNPHVIQRPIDDRIRQMIEESPALRPFANDPEFIKLIRQYGDLGDSDASTKAWYELDRRLPKTTPRMYEVDIGADPKSFLRWHDDLTDDVIDRISVPILDVIDDSLDRRGMSSMSQDPRDFTGRHLYQALKHHDVHDALPPVIGNSSWLTGDTTPERHTSAYLESLGFPGIIYPDAGSRKPGRPLTNNVVAFENTPVSILRKYENGGKVQPTLAGANPLPYIRYVKDVIDTLRPASKRAAERVIDDLQMTGNESMIIGHDLVGNPPAGATHRVGPLKQGEVDQVPIDPVELGTLWRGNSFTAPFSVHPHPRQPYVKNTGQGPVGDRHEWTTVPSLADTNNVWLNNPLTMASTGRVSPSMIILADGSQLRIGPASDAYLKFYDPAYNGAAVDMAGKVRGALQNVNEPTPGEYHRIGSLLKEWHQKEGIPYNDRIELIDPRNRSVGPPEMHPRLFDLLAASRYNWLGKQGVPIEMSGRWPSTPGARDIPIEDVMKSWTQFMMDKGFHDPEAQHGWGFKLKKGGALRHYAEGGDVKPTLAGINPLKFINFFKRSEDYLTPEEQKALEKVVRHANKTGNEGMILGRTPLAPGEKPFFSRLQPGDQNSVPVTRDFRRKVFTGPTTHKSFTAHPHPGNLTEEYGYTPWSATPSQGDMNSVWGPFGGNAMSVFNYPNLLHSKSNPNLVVGNLKGNATRIGSIDNAFDRSMTTHNKYDAYGHIMESWNPRNVYPRDSSEFDAFEKAVKEWSRANGVDILPEVTLRDGVDRHGKPIFTEKYSPDSHYLLYANKLNRLGEMGVPVDMSGHMPNAPGVSLEDAMKSWADYIGGRQNSLLPKQMQFDYKAKGGALRHFDEGGFNGPKRPVAHAISRGLLKYLGDLKNKSVSIAVNEARLPDIINDGRFKTQHEVPHSGGSYAPDFRLSVEKELFGLPETLPAPQRPVYGHMTDQTMYGARNATGYGDWNAVLTPERTKDATLTLGDSFGISGGHDVINLADPLNAKGRGVLRRFFDQKFFDKVPAFGSLAKVSPDAPLTDVEAHDLLKKRSWLSYLEAQVHGGVPWSDVKGLVYNDPNDSWRRMQHDTTLHQLADKAGVPLYFPTRAKWKDQTPWNMLMPGGRRFEEVDPSMLTDIKLARGGALRRFADGGFADDSLIPGGEFIHQFNPGEVDSRKSVAEGTRKAAEAGLKQAEAAGADDSKGGGGGGDIFGSILNMGMKFLPMLLAEGGSVGGAMPPVWDFHTPSPPPQPADINLYSGGAVPHFDKGDLVKKGVEAVRKMNRRELERLDQMRAGAQAAEVGSSSVPPGFLHAPVLRSEAPNLVSTRTVTAKTSPEDPSIFHLNVGVDPILNDADALEKIKGLIGRNPGFQFALGPNLSPQESIDRAVKQMRDNALWTVENAHPVVRQRSPHWYEGANSIANDFSGKYGLTPESSAAVLATQSPQKDWFQNVSLAERIMSTMRDREKMPMSREMEDIFNKKVGITKTGYKPEFKDIFDRIKGSRLGDLTDPKEKALWVRLYDEAHNSPFFRSVSPEGLYGDPVLTSKGVPDRRAWATLNSIEKSIRAMESGGDMDIIAAALGEANKVPSFYNNIINPWDRLLASVTGDTHQSAVNRFMPYGGNDEPVAHTLGNSMDKAKQPRFYIGHGGTDRSGQAPMYGLDADAVRLASRDLGVIPRAGQSMSWDAIRTLFGSDDKTADAKRFAANMWHEVDRGYRTPDEARAAIAEHFGGFKLPEWAASSHTLSPRTTANYRRGGAISRFADGGLNEGRDAFDPVAAARQRRLHEKGLDEYRSPLADLSILDVPKAAEKYWDSLKKRSAEWSPSYANESLPWRMLQGAGDVGRVAADSLMGGTGDRVSAIMNILQGGTLKSRYEKERALTEQSKKDLHPALRDLFGVTGGAASFHPGMQVAQQFGMPLLKAASPMIDSWSDYPKYVSDGINNKIAGIKEVYDMIPDIRQAFSGTQSVEGPKQHAGFAKGGAAHDLLGTAGSILGNLIPIPVVGSMIGKFAGNALGDLIEGNTGEIGDDAARDFTMGIADPDHEGGWNPAAIMGAGKAGASAASSLGEMPSIGFDHGGSTVGALRKAGQKARDALLAHKPKYTPGEEVYLRYGKWPENERSQNFITGGKEKGVSVFPLDYHGQLPLAWDDGGLFDSHEGHFLDRFTSDKHPRFLVQGREVGQGWDEEPLLRGVRDIEHPWARPIVGTNHEPNGLLKDYTSASPERRGYSIEDLLESFHDEPRFAEGGSIDDTMLNYHPILFARGGALRRC